MTSVFKIEDTVIHVSRSAKSMLPDIELISNERKLLVELILCILSSQEKYEIALAASKIIYRSLVIPRNRAEMRTASIQIERVLSRPIAFKYQEKKYSRRIRFFQRKIEYITRTIEKIYLGKITLRSILTAENQSIVETRKKIMEYGCGIGPKQASMFLRNVGYSNDLAVLDKHVIDYMRILGLTDFYVNSVSNMHIYQKMESRLKLYATENQLTLLHLDLAIWTTMRTLKAKKNENCDISLRRN
jgi:N-glycosylase/DNA lyase